MSIKTMNAMNGNICGCGKTHRFSAEVVIGKGAVQQLPQYIQKLNAGKAFVLSDKNTFAAAGDRVCAILREHHIPCTSYVFEQDALEPDEHSVGSAVMHFDTSCDIIIGVGSGVINDIGKILSSLTGKPYIIVGTAPSMDGYASATSSMTRDGLKISLPSRSADVIIGDTDILRNAPMKMMVSGLGDMIAKYVSICEWRIAHLVCGEYYCPEIAQLIRSAVSACVDNAQGLLERREEAVQAVFEGLVIGGVAMNYAGLSRPASGVEHYISHVLDMRGAEFGTKVESHGIQCAMGTLIATRAYEKLTRIRPDGDKARSYTGAFDLNAWHTQLRRLLGRGAESMIALEAKEGKYDLAGHGKRLNTILEHWEQILQIIQQELPSCEDLEQLLDTLGIPKTLSQIGTDDTMLPAIFSATKDIRDKYVLSRLAWDLGVLNELI